MHRHRRRPRPHALAIKVRFADLPPEDIVVIHGFRVTSLIRTLIDLSGDLPTHEAARLARQAIAKGLTTLPELQAAAERRTDVPAIHEFREVVRTIAR